jgi:sugar lactone lactonase YvrE
MWSSPWDERYASVTIRRAKGSIPPDTPTSGGYVPPTGDDAYLTPGTLYSYTVFPHNARGSYGPPATLQITTSTAGGTVTRVAGGSADAGEPPHACGDGGPALDACLENANDVAADGAGNVYVADGLAGVRKINTSGVITTVAGHSGCADGLTGDGKQATAACVSAAQVAVAPDGTVYVADHSVNSAINNPVVIRKIDTSGVITTFAGKDPYVYAYDLAVDQDGNVYVAGGNVVVRVTPAGAVTPIAGNDWNPRGLCADGAPAVGDCLSSAESVAVDPQGNVLIGDPGNRRIFEVSDGKIRTVAGIGTWGFCGDGGPATAACINDPLGLAFDRSGNLLIADGENRIRKLVLGGALTTIAGTGGRSLQPCADTSPALDPCLDEIRSIAVDPQDHIYLSDMQLRRIAELHPA